MHVPLCTLPLFDCKQTVVVGCSGVAFRMHEVWRT